MSRVVAVDLSGTSLSPADHQRRTVLAPLGELRRLCDPTGEAVALMVGSHPRVAPHRWVDPAAAPGFAAASLPRTAGGEKGVDELLALWAMSTLTVTTPGTLILVSGDGDHASLLYAADAYGWRTEVWFFRAATSGLLLAAADAYMDLTPELGRLRHRSLTNVAQPAPRVLAGLAGPRSVVRLPNTAA